jgi:signal transduction histidine kinase
VIIGNVGLARTKYPSSEELQHIIIASDRAAHLTSQLLAYAGKGQFVAKTFDVGDLVSRSMQLLSASVPKRVNLKFNQPGDELLIEADPSQIEQIIMNLVINAGEAIPPHRDGTGSTFRVFLPAAGKTASMDLPAGTQPGVSWDQDRRRRSSGS